MCASPSPADSPSTKCRATTAAGKPCNAWAVRRSNPPRCAPHGGGARPVGAPKRNRNALKHGMFVPTDPPPRNIDEIFADLATKQAALSGYIDAELHTLTVDGLVNLLRIHGQNASRLGRLLRDKRALSGEAADGISAAISQALDELSTELGIDL